MQPDCALDEVFAARAGGPVADVRYLESPVRRGRRARAGKDVNGEDLAHHVDGENVTVQWAEGDADDETGAAVLAAAEAAWSTLLGDGWPAPVSSDRYLLWVILDPTLAGTGYTAEYVSDEFPEGYPIVYVNPVWFADYPDFVRSVTVHELGHAIQYAMRDATSASGEFWYWEASAEWMAELGAPDLDEYARSAEYYATQPSLAHDSVVNAHAYGMFLLNASLAEDDLPLREVWEENEGEAWEDHIAALAGADFSEVIGRMAARYDAGALRESDLYTPLEVEARDTVPRGEVVSVQTLGTAAYRIADMTGWALSGPARVDFVVGGEITDAAPDAGPADVLLTRLEPGDIVIGANTGQKDTGEGGGGCGCATGTPGGWPAMGLLLAALSRRGPAGPRSRSPARRAARPGAGSR